jgi:hypothetical protein
MPKKSFCMPEKAFFMPERCMPKNNFFARRKGKNHAEKVKCMPEK